VTFGGHFRRRNAIRPTFSRTSPESFVHFIDTTEAKVSHLMIGLLSLVLSSRAELATAQVAAETITKTEAEKKEPPSEPVSVENGKAALTPKNTTIQFVGLHTGVDPKPRTGYFSKFKGELAIDKRTNIPTAANVDIETKSLITQIGRLTSHLQSPDFFDVEQFPKANFKQPNSKRPTRLPASTRSPAT
jgi:polyisoprenoid-binding protein YceI